MADDEDLTPAQLWTRHQQFISARETGMWLLNRRQPGKSYQFLDKAYRVEPNDIRTLTGITVHTVQLVDVVHSAGKARCKLELMEYEAAIKHAKQISALKPRSLPATYLSARAIYELGEVEDALVTYHRGLQMVSNPGEFGVGRQKAEATIKTCVGMSAGPILEALLPVVQWLEERKRRFSSGRLRVGDAELAREGLPDAWQEWTSLWHLGSLHVDKELLRELRTSATCRAGDRQDRARVLASLAHDVLLQAEEMMETARPYYTINRWHDKQVKKVAGLWLERKTAEVRRRSRKVVDKVLSVEDTKELKVFLVAADVAVGWLKSQMLKILPDKRELLNVVYNTASRVYLRQKSFSYDHFAPGDEKRLARLFLGFPVTGRHRLDSAFEKLNNPLLNYRQVVASALRGLKTSVEPAERCYLLYTLAACASHVGRHGDAKLHARRCQEAAHAAGLADWRLNALMLLFRSFVKHDQSVDALIALEDAERVATAAGRPQLLPFIAECRRVVDEPRDERSPQDVARAREEGLLRAMERVGLTVRAQRVVKRLRSLPFRDRLLLPAEFDPVSKIV